MNGQEWILVDGELELPAQTCPYHGERTIKVHVRYPGGNAESIGPNTGLMLSLHNWGGTGFVGAPDPAVMTARYDVVCIGVDYLQSGEGAPPPTGYPYDMGYLQTLDVLRALYCGVSGLRAAATPFDATRLYSVGGSGGANVGLMANKFAPRTFACIVDLSGPGSLTDYIAFGSEDGNDVRAGYSRDRRHPNYLPPHGQQIRDAGNREHLAVMKALGNAATVVTVHGVEDLSCDIEDKKRVLAAMREAGLTVHANLITVSDLDGVVLRDCGHTIGNRAELVRAFADPFLRPDSAALCRTAGPCDFDRRDQTVVYPVEGGCYVIDYRAGYPVGTFKMHR